MTILHYRPPANTAPFSFTYAGRMQTLMPPDMYWERVKVRKIVGHQVGEDGKAITDPKRSESSRFVFAELTVWIPTESELLKNTRPEQAGLSRTSMTTEMVRTLRQNPQRNSTLVRGERDPRSEAPDVYKVIEVTGLERHLVDEDQLMSGHLKSLHEVEAELQAQRDAIATQVEDESARLEAYRREEVERIRQEARNQAEQERDAILKEENERMRKAVADKVRRQTARADKRSAGAADKS